MHGRKSLMLLHKEHEMCQGSWNMLIIPAFGRRTQMDQIDPEFKIRLGETENYQDPVSKQKQKQKDREEEIQISSYAPEFGNREQCWKLGPPPPSDSLPPAGPQFLTSHKHRNNTIKRRPSIQTCEPIGTASHSNHNKQSPASRHDLE